MRKGGRKLDFRISALALATCLLLSPGSHAFAQQDAPASPERGTSSQERRISFTVPLIYGERVLGDVLVEVGASGAGPTLVEASTFRRQMVDLLTEDGLAVLDDTIAGESFVGLDRLSEAGFAVRFDQNRLELVLDLIRGEYRPVGSLGQSRQVSSSEPLPTIQPADFSAYMNVNANFDYSERDGADVPGFFIFGAARHRNIVLEFDGAFTEQFGDDYRFFRRSVRAVYDDPDSYRRYSAGDLRLNTISLLRTPFIGGVAVEKRRQIFDPFQPIPLLGGREIFLDSRSNVEVLINGNRVRTLQLDAGRYDLSDLPLESGSNNVEVIVTDSAGRRQMLDLNYFFEPLDLAVGEEEYVFGTGFVARDIDFEPEYSSAPVFIGHYRRAFTENLVLGGAAEISEDLQVFASEAAFVPQFIPGVFDAEIAASFGDGTGLALRAGYRLQGGNSFAERRQLSITVNYESSNYQTVGNLFPSDFDLLTISGSYTHAFSERTFANGGVVFSRRGGGRIDRKLAFVDVVHRLSDRVQLTGGLVYGEDEFTRQNFGIHLGLTIVFGERTRLFGDYRSRRGITRVNASRGASDTVGSFGYEFGFTDSRGSTNIDAGADYVGNRFDARATLISSGTSLGSIADEQRARIQIGTSFAIADGQFGIGRPINDSFAVVDAHPALAPREVISGRSLSSNDYYARSGFLGGAVQSDLSSYSTQSIEYDLADTDSGGFSIGDGTARVDPRFRSGYKIVVGDSRFVSAVGNLQVGDMPASLWAGTITSVDDEGFEPVPFFTNSVGRFGVIGLAPGKTYTVNIPREGQSFVIEVPEDNEGLLRLGVVQLPETNE